MRTVDFDDIFEDVVRASGKPGSTTLTDTQAERYARYIQHRLKRIWTWDFWPFLTRYEERDTVEAADDAVYVPREVDFQEAIGALYENGIVTGVCKDNPRTNSAPDWLEVSELEDGIFLPAGESASAVFLTWRRPTPRFTKVAWDGSTTYSAGDVVWHDDTDNCYEAIMGNTGKTPGSGSSYWRLQEIPEHFESYVRMGAAADVMLEDGNLQDFGVMENLAESELRNIATRFRQPQRVRVMIEARGEGASGATAAAGVTAEPVEATAEIDWAAVDTTAVYTVPSGYDLVILGWILTTDTIEGTPSKPAVELGTDSDADAFWSGDANVDSEDGTHVIDRPQKKIAAGTVIEAAVTGASTATTHEGKVVIRGHLIATS